MISPNKIRYRSSSRSLTRKALEPPGGRERLADNPNTLDPTGAGRSGVYNNFASVEYIIFTEAVVAVNELRVYVSTILWCCTESPRWQSHRRSQPIDRQSRLRVRAICLSLMTRYPGINNQGIFHPHHIKLHKISCSHPFLSREAASPGAKMTCLYALLFCIPAMNVIVQFALSLAEGFIRHGCLLVETCDSKRSSSLL